MTRILGINTHWATGPELALARDAGFTWTRTGCGWGTVEPAWHPTPQYDWRIADAIVEAHLRYGFKMLWELGGAPPWAAAVLDATPVAAAYRFGQFAYELADRYPGDVTHFDPMNEPNLARFWTRSVTEYVEQYLVPAYISVKAVSASNKIVAPGLAAVGSSARISVKKFFQELDRLDAWKYIDIVGQHAYDDLPRRLAEQFTHGDYGRFLFLKWQKRAALFDIYDRAGMAGKPVWLTEFGWRTEQVGEQRQGQNIIEMFERLDERVQAAFVYELRDDSRDKARWGILKSSGVPKKALEAIRRWSAHG